MGNKLKVVNVMTRRCN